MLDATTLLANDAGAEQQRKNSLAGDVVVKQQHKNSLAGDVVVKQQREQIRNQLLSFIVANETRRQQERGQR